MNAEQMTLLILGVCCALLIGFVIGASMMPVGEYQNSKEHPLTEHHYCESHPGYEGCITTLFTESIAFISGSSLEIECCPDNYTCTDTLYLNCSNKED